METPCFALPGRGLVVSIVSSRKEAAMWRVAIYAREAPGRAGRPRLDRQVTSLAAQIARQPTWRHVATYGDLDVGPPGARPGLSRLIADAPGRFDLVALDGFGRLSANRQELRGLLAYLEALGVRVVVMRSSSARRVARPVANVALADLIGEAAR
jgi:DNA invertase Pin-like site-specific DNA recombinase